MSSSFDFTPFFSGAVAGVVQTVIGHPFDTIKTRIQNHKFNKSFSPSIWYRGAFYPFVSGVFMNSFIFGVHKNISHLLGGEGGGGAGDEGASDGGKPIIVSAISGGISGMLVTYFIVPFENWKVQSQTRVCGSFLKNNGFMRSAFHGTGITMLRESSAMSIYFGTYDYLRGCMEYGSFLSGLGAGLTNWAITYPIDTIKSRIQSYKYGSVRAAINAGGLWNGISIVLLRAAIVNGSIFYTYEKFQEV